MKKQYLVLMAAFLPAMTLPVGAQNNKNNQQETLVGKVSKLWKDAKKQIDKTGKDIGEKIGFDELASKKHEADLIEVDGIKYMPVYTTDHFAKLPASRGYPRRRATEGLAEYRLARRLQGDRLQASGLLLRGG